MNECEHGRAESGTTVVLDGDRRRLIHGRGMLMTDMDTEEVVFEKEGASVEKVLGHSAGFVSRLRTELASYSERLDTATRRYLKAEHERDESRTLMEISDRAKQRAYDEVTRLDAELAKATAEAKIAWLEREKTEELAAHEARARVLG